MEIQIPNKMAKEITIEYLSNLSPGQLDTIFAEQISEFHDADKLFKKVKQALADPMRVS